MDEPIVTIPLSEYDRLKEEARHNYEILELIRNYGDQLGEVRQRLFDLENRRNQ